MPHRLACALLLALVPLATLRAEPPEDALPPGAVARLGSYRFYHGGQIYALAVSPDGKRLVTSGVTRPEKEGDKNWVNRVWDVATGELLYSGLRLYGMPTAFSRDGKFVAAMSGATITVWDAASMRNRLEIASGNRPADLTFSTDGRNLIVCSNDDAVIWYDLETGKPTRRRDPWPNSAPKGADGHAAEEVSKSAISPDERVAAFGIKTSKAYLIRLVDAATGKVLRDVPADEPCLSLAFSPDGRTLAEGSQGGARLIDVADGKVTHALTDGGAFARRAVFSPDGRNVAVCFETSLRVYNRKSGKIIWQHRIELLPDDLVLFTDPRLAYLPDGKTLACAIDAWTRQFDARTGVERPLQGGHAGRIRSIRFAHDGRTLTTSTGNTFGTWDLAARRLTRLFEPNYPDSAVLPIVRSDDGGLYCWCDEHTAPVLYDGATGKPLRRLQTDARQIIRGTFSLDRRILALSFNSETKEYPWEFFEVATGKKLYRFLAPLSGKSAFLQDGSRFAYLTDEMQLRVLDVAPGRELMRIATVAPKYSNSEAFFELSADGRIVAVSTSELGGDNYRVRMFAVSAGAEIFSLRLPPESRLTCGRLSPDGRLVAIGYDDETGIRVFEVASGLLYHRFDGHRDAVLSAAFAPDGRTLATGGKDGVALVWDMRYPLRTKAKAAAADLWANLASTDVPTAWAAIYTLADAPNAVRLLRERMRPARAVPPEVIARLIDALSAPAFADRERAAHDLVALGDSAKPGLEQSLKGQLAPEGRKRVQALLDQLRSPALTGERLRQWRAVAVLERVGTPDAAALLGELTGGWGEARLTRDAADAQARLAERRTK